MFSAPPFSILAFGKVRYALMTEQSPTVYFASKCYLSFNPPRRALFLDF